MSYVIEIVHFLELKPQQKPGPESRTCLREHWSRQIECRHKEVQFRQSWLEIQSTTLRSNRRPELGEAPRQI